MFGRTLTKQSMKNCLDKSKLMKKWLEQADAVLIGAGSGLSAAAGLTYSGERFNKYFSDFRDKYGIRDMYSGGFYPFPNLETYWGWWSRHIWYNRYEAETNGVYGDLLRLIKDKNYFVITTNVDHQFKIVALDLTIQGFNYMDLIRTDFSICREIMVCFSAPEDVIK